MVNITRNDTEANITRNDTEAIRISNDVIMGLVMSYSYPTQQIMISNLINDTMYIYCVAAYDNNNMIVGKEVCDSFTTMRAGMAYVCAYIYTNSHVLYTICAYVCMCVVAMYYIRIRTIIHIRIMYVCTYLCLSIALVMYICT